MIEGQEGIINQPQETTTPQQEVQPAMETSKINEDVKKKWLAEKIAKLEQMHQLMQSASPLTPTQLDTYMDKAYDLFDWTDENTSDAVMAEVMDRLNQIAPVSPEVQAAIMKGKEHIKVNRELREVRKNLYAQFKEQFVAALLDRGLTPVEVEDEAMLADHELSDEFHVDSLREVILRQAQQRGLNTAGVGKDIE